MPYLNQETAEERRHRINTWSGECVAFTHNNQHIALHVKPVEQGWMDYVTLHVVGDQTFYECKMLDAIARKYPKHETIIEVGANVGNHVRYYETFLEFDRLIAFEPSPQNFEILKKNLLLDKSYALPIALGEHPGKCSLQQTVPGNCGSITTVPGSDFVMETLDRIAPTGVTLLKIDVEGGELRVLRGGIRTLIYNRPVIIIEMSRDEYEIRSFLASLGYRQSDIYECDGVFTHEFVPIK